VTGKTFQSHSRSSEMSWFNRAPTISRTWQPDRRTEFLYQ